MPKVMPRQKPGESVQEVGTPRDFLDAVERRFGPVGLDLAANASNAVCRLWAGPGSPLEGGEDALAPSFGWGSSTPARGQGPLRWINPPFANIDPWAAKCAAERHHAFIAMLTPASVGSNWFAEHVHQKALVLAIRPRLIFVGSTDPYPKDLILSVWGPLVCAGFDVWKWK